MKRTFSIFSCALIAVLFATGVAHGVYLSEQFSKSLSIMRPAYDKAIGLSSIANAQVNDKESKALGDKIWSIVELMGKGERWVDTSAPGAIGGGHYVKIPLDEGTRQEIKKALMELRAMLNDMRQRSKDARVAQQFDEIEELLGKAPYTDIFPEYRDYFPLKTKK